MAITQLILDQMDLINDYELYKFREIYGLDRNDVIFNHMHGFRSYMEIASKTIEDLEQIIKL